TDHSVFYNKDENPDRESAIVYRERLIKVGPDITKDKVTELLQYYFETLRRQIGQISGDRQINLAVYDHEFTGKPEGLALAAISWQEWKNPEPMIVYPREEAARKPSASSQGFEYAPTNPQHISHMPPPQAEPIGPPPSAGPAPAPATSAPSSAPLISPAYAKVPANLSVDVQMGPVPQAAPPRAAPPQAAPPRAAPPQAAYEPVVEEFDADRVLSEVFEQLQDMFLMQTQDDCAEFVIDLAMEKIPVEGGTIFLADINTRDMLFAAVRGPSSGSLKGRVLDMRKGIVGFTAREGAAIAISDVSKDPRFCSDFDQTGDFKTKSVLCAPIQYEGRTFGAIELLNKIGNDMFTQGEINVITYLASQLAEFIATSLPSGEPDFLEEERQHMQPAKQAQPASPAKRGKPKAKSKGRGGKK
ncbi:MAG: GAF domain-containing protein, partial [Pseudomonadota bacterium]